MILHSLRWDLQLNPLNFDPKCRPRRQEWTGEFIESGHFYCFTTNLVQNEGLIQGGKCGVVEIPKHFCVEIDDMIDWKIAEQFIKINI
ncbi:unnamed protein product [Medioppia subpectinata]|uniref:Uncharacterized protein n=1 Tax=Medioppia subpectinata TaxID=1979941 RepID=A0A7R9PTT5_9ACAR|nr:unnamed protein product [Medioppia subpectinata]CAG2101006.1 unnamed protein product [Medioppia subpectinata]